MRLAWCVDDLDCTPGKIQADLADFGLVMARDHFLPSSRVSFVIVNVVKISLGDCHGHPKSQSTSYGENRPELRTTS
jgi:hypothetical protein